jgi:sugar O-acyltransferase (sialic acid O-acetyltransferase NeuD family)
MDTLQTIGRWSASELCFADDDPKLHGTLILGCRVRSGSDAQFTGDMQFHIAIGDNIARSRVHSRLASSGAELITITHPRSTISAHCQLARGVFVAAGGVIGPLSKVGEATIVNHGAVIDHECVIGAFAHIAPNATIGGGVIVGSLVLIGAGAVVLPGVQIGSEAIVGAGAVVTTDVASGSVVVGIPARSRQTI